MGLSRVQGQPVLQSKHQASQGYISKIRLSQKQKNKEMQTKKQIRPAQASNLAQWLRLLAPKPADLRLIPTWQKATGHSHL